MWFNRISLIPWFLYMYLNCLWMHILTQFLYFCRHVRRTKTTTRVLQRGAEETPNQSSQRIIQNPCTQEKTTHAFCIQHTGALLQYLHYQISYWNGNIFHHLMTRFPKTNFVHAFQKKVNRKRNLLCNLLCRVSIL